MDKNIDSFSWRRCAGIYRMYGRSIRKQLLLYAILTVAIYLLMVLLLKLRAGMSFMPLYALLSVMLAYLAYVSPMVFAGRDDSLMTQLPATPGEKTVFYVGYCCVFVALFIQIIWYILCHAGGYIFSVGNVDDAIMDRVYTDATGFILSPGFKTLSVVTNYVQAMFMILLSLYVVMTRRSHVFIKCLLCPVVVLVVIGVISGIAGMIIGFREGFSSLAGGDVDIAAGEQVAREIVDGMIPVVMALSVLTLSGVVYIIYKLNSRFRHPRIVR